MGSQKEVTMKKSMFLVMLTLLLMMLFVPMAFGQPNPSYPIPPVDFGGDDDPYVLCGCNCPGEDGTGCAVIGTCPCSCSCGPAGNTCSCASGFAD